MAPRSMGDMISSLRKERGLTQRELAEKLNITDKAVSKWERDLSCPDIGSLPALAEILGVSVEELLRTGSRKNGTSAFRRWLHLTLKSISLAMGVSLAVTSLMGEMTLEPGLFMAGLGLFCLSLERFLDEEAE